MIKRIAFGKTYITNITFATNKKILIKWLRRGQIVEVSAAARSALFAACVTDADYTAASAIPHKTDLELAYEQLAT